LLEMRTKFSINLAAVQTSRRQTGDVMRVPNCQHTLSLSVSHSHTITRRQPYYSARCMPVGKTGPVVMLFACSPSQRLRWSSALACWRLVPKNAGSNSAAAVGFFGRKYPQHAFLRRGSKVKEKNPAIYVEVGIAGQIDWPFLAKFHPSPTEVSHVA
jgi:hypothetical protein